MFSTDYAGRINGRELSDGTYIIKVTARVAGISPMNHHYVNHKIVYDIVLETLLYGAPFDVVKLGLFVASAVVLLIFILIPQIFPRLPGLNKLVD